jgi:Zn-dependent protease
MRQTLSLGRLFDIRVGVHVSWIVVFALMTTSIAGTIDGVSRSLAYALAALCTLLLFASVTAHEFAHALIARQFGVRTQSITLFLFGGVATLESEPPTPRAEVAIALAGPAMSAVLAALAFGGLMVLDRTLHGPVGESVGLLVTYLAFANGVLAVFNIVPAYPMDGGRVLRAAIWRVRKSRAAATGAASIVGLVVAGGVVIAASVAVIGYHAWSDAWYVAVGLFLLRQSGIGLRESRAAEREERTAIVATVDRAA